MKVKAIGGAVLAILIVGCSYQRPIREARLMMHDDEGKWEFHLLPASEAEFVEGVVASAPDRDYPGAMPLEPNYLVEIKRTRYAVVENELILLGNNRVKRWNSQGIQKRLLAAVGK